MYGINIFKLKQTITKQNSNNIFLRCLIITSPCDESDAHDDDDSESTKLAHGGSNLKGAPQPRVIAISQHEKY